MLEDAGFAVEVADKRGYDHGAWTPMMLAFPAADIPIVQLSIDPTRDAAYHYALGKALAPLRDDDILLIGSGHITHNLRAVFGAMRGGLRPDADMAGKVDAFTGWFADAFARGDRAAILDWKEKAPFVAENHPTDEHLMPLFFAYGAGGEGASAKRVHDFEADGLLRLRFLDVWLIAGPDWYR